MIMYLRLYINKYFIGTSMIEVEDIKNWLRDGEDFDAEKAIDRRVKDPDGALTAARTLIETVCKHILTKLNIEFSDKDDINSLYSLTSEALEISASQHIDKESKKVFGNINAIVSGLAFFRNKLGDAHGQCEKNEL